MSVKKISIDSLTVGMYVVGIDRSWLDTPFLRHQFLLKKQSQIDKMKRCGIRVVDIDPDQGLDVQHAEHANTSTIHEESSSPTQIEEAKSDERLEDQIPNLPESTRGVSLAGELTAVQEIHGQMCKAMRNVLEGILNSGVVQTETVHALTQEVIDHTLSHSEALFALFQTKKFSPDLYEHLVSVGILAVILGRHIGMGDEQLRHLAMGAFLHDIGYLRLPSGLRRPQRTLSASEMSLAETHPLLGMEILQGSEGISDEVLRIVAEHHLTPDGQGFPRDTAVDGIALTSRVVAVVETYHELVTGRADRPPLQVPDALRELYEQSRKNRLDRDLVSQLISHVGIYPVYSLVELNTGERGIVTALTPGKVHQPMVLVFQGPHGDRYDEPMPVNFANQSSSHDTLEVVRVLDAEREGISIEGILNGWERF